MQLTGAWLNNANLRRVLSVLSANGAEAYMVGGCVRNSLLGRDISDIDIATSLKPQETLDYARKAGIKAIPTGADHGTITLVENDDTFEVTTFRKDIDTNGRQATVVFSDRLEEDAKRRDFTINALYADLEGKVIDPLGGLEDLKKRRLRFIEDPAQRIREDYLRILRYFRFYAWYANPDNGFDAKALDAIAQNVEGLELLSRERIGAEMLKLLSAPDPAPALATMQQIGVLPAFLPGSDTRALPLILHFEHITGISLNALTRLASLGGSKVSERLRLSKKQSHALALMREHMGSTMGIGELSYRFGAILAESILLLRAAQFETQPHSVELEAITRGAEAHFPIKAQDLDPALKGAALGTTLKRLEQRWIDSGFRLSKLDLLN